MTDKLYYKDPYLREFDAQVISCEKEGERWAVLLDRTAFYPEGGGQPADRGILGGLELLDVQKKEGKVFHYLGSPVKIEKIDGSLDWKHRLEYMEQHTGQHLLSSVLKRVIGAETMAVHQAPDYTSIEIDRQKISEKEILKVEQTVNAMIRCNSPIFLYENGDLPIENFPIRRATKHREGVRLVQVGGLPLIEGDDLTFEQASERLAAPFEPCSEGILDLAACGGVHTSSTSQVGLIRFAYSERVRGRVRLFWIIGRRAYSDYQKKSVICSSLGESLSVPIDGIIEEVSRLSNALNDEKKKSDDLRKEIARFYAHDLEREDQVIRVFEDLDLDLFKKISMELSTRKDLTRLIFNKRGDQGQWTLISTGDNPIDFKQFKEKILPLFDGKGGGRSPLWQGKAGVIALIEEIEKAFAPLLT